MAQAPGRTGSSPQPPPRAPYTRRQWAYLRFPQPRPRHRRQPGSLSHQPGRLDDGGCPGACHPVSALPAYSPATFNVVWGGSDTGGSGIVPMTCRCATVPPGTWTDWLTGVTGTTLGYPGVDRAHLLLPQPGDGRGGQRGGLSRRLRRLHQCGYASALHRSSTICPPLPRQRSLSMEWHRPRRRRASRLTTSRGVTAPAPGQTGSSPPPPPAQLSTARRDTRLLPQPRPG